jgi:hypothetical protein
MHEVKKQGWQIRVAAYFVATFLPMVYRPAPIQILVSDFSILSGHMKQL